MVALVAGGPMGHQHGPRGLLCGVVVHDLRSA